jgi:Mrp family chromosome partitioning ATPase
MVERLKQAIEKAREARSQLGAPENLPDRRVVDRVDQTVPTDIADLWTTLPLREPDPQRLKAGRIVSADSTGPGRAAFDLLRTRVLKPCLDNRWTSIAVTSPTKGCGKSVVSSNLAFSIARNPDMRTMLLDVDLRAPSLATTLGTELDASLADYLQDKADLAKAAHRIMPNLVLMANNVPVLDSAEFMLAQSTHHKLAQARRDLRPTIMIFDLPPMLGCDDAQAFLPNVDAVLLVIGGGATTASNITACERMLENGPHLLGMVLNRAEDADTDDYYDTYRTPALA